MDMSKADKIRELRRDEPKLTSGDVAERVDTTAQYVREVWNRMDDNTDEPSDTDTGDADDPLAELDAGDGGDEPTGGSDIDPDGPLAEMIISDKWDEYECGECEATVEYLQDTCDECGESLAWWSDA